MIFYIELLESYKIILEPVIMIIIKFGEKKSNDLANHDYHNNWLSS